jgi:hypothetical protein
MFVAATTGYCAVLKGPGLSPVPVAMARGKHLFPFRTEQLSPSAPMVLGPQGPGRVGRRRFSFATGRPRAARSSLPARHERLPALWDPRRCSALARARRGCGAGLAPAAVAIGHVDAVSPARRGSGVAALGPCAAACAARGGCAAACAARGGCAAACAARGGCAAAGAARGGCAAASRESRLRGAARVGARRESRLPACRRAAARCDSWSPRARCAMPRWRLALFRVMRGSAPRVCHAVRPVPVHAVRPECMREGPKLPRGGATSGARHACGPAGTVPGRRAGRRRMRVRGACRCACAAVRHRRCRARDELDGAG